MVEKVKNLWSSFEVWSILSGWGEVFGLASKVIKFLVYFMASNTLVLGGYLQLQEIWGRNNPILMLSYVISIWVTMRGAAEAARHGLL